MARYYDTQPDLRFVALDLAEQLRPGTFEHALAYLIDHELDLSHFDTRYRADDSRESAIPSVTASPQSSGSFSPFSSAEPDGEKLPSTASTHKSTIRAEFER